MPEADLAASALSEAPIHLGLVPGARIRVVSGRVVADLPNRRITFRMVPEGTVRALLRLDAAPTGTRELEAAVRGRDGPGGLVHWRYHLRALEEECAICYSLRERGVTLARLVPLASGYLDGTPRARSTSRAMLSRFAMVRRVGPLLVLESPRSLARVELHPRVLPVLGALTHPVTRRAVRAAPARLSPAAAAGVVALLEAAGMLTWTGRSGDRETADPALAPWEFADLAFHARSRIGRHDGPVGATYPFLGRFPSPPALKRPMSRRVVSLARPSIRGLMLRGAPFTRVLEARRSIRAYGSRAITIRELGQFLFRVARVRREMPARPAAPYPVTSRPYPSGGACYPLELYPAVGRCDGLAPGLYHYDPRRHRLELLAGREAHAGRLLSAAAEAAALNAEPQVLIVLGARFARLSWKYRAMAYATLLKEVGVLYQTMYLVATAMGLAPCAVGCGDAELFAQAIGTAFHEESSVGEFLLGSAAGSRRVEPP